MKRDILNDQQWDKLDRYLRDPYKTMIAIMRFTACRSCEVRGLTVKDVYGSPGNPRDQITFPQNIRKGKGKPLTVPVSDRLYAYLKLYNHPENGLLFPSRYKADQSISYEALLIEFKIAARKAGLGHLALGTHTGRRSALTKLNNEGFSLRTIQEISGHSSLASLQRYLEVSPQQLSTAINSL
jgi:integrase/recombinase XerD